MRATAKENRQFLRVVRAAEQHRLAETRIVQSMEDPWSGNVPAAFEKWREIMAATDRNRGWRGLVGRYAFAVPNLDALDALACLGPLVELGAGDGYWARLLRDRGVDVVAYDRVPGGHGDSNGTRVVWTKIDVGTEAAIRHHPNRTLFICWPYRPAQYAADALKACARGVAALVTHPTRLADDEDPLFDELEKRWNLVKRVELPQIPSRPDALLIYERRATTDARRRLR
jgi:hypothetical protein